MANLSEMKSDLRRIDDSEDETAEEYPFATIENLVQARMESRSMRDDIISSLMDSLDDSNRNLAAANKVIEQLNECLSASNKVIAQLAERTTSAPPSRKRNAAGSSGANALDDMTREQLIELIVSNLTARQIQTATDRIKKKRNE